MKKKVQISFWVWIIVLFTSIYSLIHGFIKYVNMEPINGVYLENPMTNSIRFVIILVFIYLIFGYLFFETHSPLNKYKIISTSFKIPIFANKIQKITRMYELLNSLDIDSTMIYNESDDSFNITLSENQSIKLNSNNLSYFEKRKYDKFKNGMIENIYSCAKYYGIRIKINIVNSDGTVYEVINGNLNI